ncbi:hypothetical protein CGCF415_v012582 [Colletotrichum fructicola]|nr:hypothetical protein CGCFRS4_v010803 [Colletotrichum fructicola]KAF4893602.1 hypothetical protein CGCF415_v012582 [Colletotrichum fructicola]KAF4928779.1 hypothetical protein CGCF245_v012541 [Colletotrichum fructicola]
MPRRTRELSLATFPLGTCPPRVIDRVLSICCRRSASKRRCRMKVHLSRVWWIRRLQITCLDNLVVRGARRE